MNHHSSRVETICRCISNDISQAAYGRCQHDEHSDEYAGLKRKEKKRKMKKTMCLYMCFCNRRKGAILISYPIDQP